MFGKARRFPYQEDPPDKSKGKKKPDKDGDAKEDDKSGAQGQDPQSTEAEKDVTEKPTETKGELQDTPSRQLGTEKASGDGDKSKQQKKILGWQDMYPKRGSLKPKVSDEGVSQERHLGKPKKPEQKLTFKTMCAKTKSPRNLEVYSSIHSSVRSSVRSSIRSGKPLKTILKKVRCQNESCQTSLVGTEDKEEVNEESTVVSVQDNKTETRGSVRSSKASEKQVHFKDFTPKEILTSARRHFLEARKKEEKGSRLKGTKENSETERTNSEVFVTKATPIYRPLTNEDLMKMPKRCGLDQEDLKIPPPSPFSARSARSATKRVSLPTRPLVRHKKYGMIPCSNGPELSRERRKLLYAIRNELECLQFRGDLLFNTYSIPLPKRINKVERRDFSSQVYESELRYIRPTHRCSIFDRRSRFPNRIDNNFPYKLLPKDEEKKN